MKVKTYGIYDSVQEEYVQTFTAANDNDAKRQAALIVRSPNFNDKQFNDRSIHHLYDWDSSTGQVIDNSIRQVFLFSTAISERKQEELEKVVQEKLVTDEFKQELKEIILKDILSEVKNDAKLNA